MLQSLKVQGYSGQIGMLFDLGSLRRQGLGGSELRRWSLGLPSSIVYIMPRHSAVSYPTQPVGAGSPAGRGEVGGGGLDFNSFTDFLTFDS